MKKKLILTPTGTLTGFVALEKPSTKFDEDGVYSCHVDFTGNRATKVKQTIDALMLESLQKGQKAGISKEASPPYTVENNNITVRFKQKALIKSVVGEAFNINIQFYDGKGIKIEEELGISAGSEVKIAYAYYAWSSHALGAGVTLQPVCLQIIKLVKYESENSNPFTAIDGSYESANKDVNPFDKDTTSQSGDF